MIPTFLPRLVEKSLPSQQVLTRAAVSYSGSQALSIRAASFPHPVLLEVQGWTTPAWGAVLTAVMHVVPAQAFWDAFHFLLPDNPAPNTPF